MILHKALSRLNKRQAATFANATTTPQSLPELIGNLGMKTRSGQVVTPENSKNVATAYRCGNIITDDIAKMPLQTLISQYPGDIQRMRPDVMMQNIAYRLEVQPNRWWTPFWFKKVASLWLVHWGNAYIWKPPVYSNELYILPSNATYPVFDQDGALWYMTKFYGDTKETPIPAAEVAHWMINPDPTGFIGRGVIQFARETIGRQLAGYSSQGGLFKNGLSAAGILWLNGESKKDARQKVREMYEEVMSGDENANRIAILDNKVSKFEPVTMQPKDIQFLELLRDNDIAIMNFYGVPAYKLNTGKQAYNSNEQQNLDYLSSTLDPYLVQMEESARLKWISVQEQSTTFFRFERSALFRTDAKSRGEYLNAAIQNGRMTPNQAIQIEDRPKNSNPAADLLYMPANIQPMGAAAKQGATNA
jgi:HK97 family phage portal protein